MDELENYPLPIPDRSYTQELLDTPVPLENRIELLSAYVLPTAKIHTLSQLVKKLEITPRSVHELSQALGIEFKEAADGTEEYPLFTYELLEEELAWDEIIAEQDDYVSAEMISRIVGRDVRWVKYRANELAVFPSHQMTATKRMSLAYPKSLIAQLRHVMLHTPAAGEWSSIAELAEEVGKDREWVVKRLQDSGIESQERIGRLNHNSNPHYPPMASEYLLECLQVENNLAGSWVTAAYIEHSVGRTSHWVSARLASYYQVKELRLDDTMKRTWHYPPEVLKALKAESEQEMAVQAAEEFMTVKALAQKLGRSVLWVRNRVAEIEATPEIRRNRSNRSYEYYSPDVLEELTRINEQVRD